MSDRRCFTSCEKDEGRTMSDESVPAPVHNYRLRLRRRQVRADDIDMPVLADDKCGAMRLVWGERKSGLWIPVMDVD